MVTIMDWATSAASPATRAEAVCKKVGAPPKPTPQTTTAAITTTGDPPHKPMSRAAAANRIVLARAQLLQALVDQQTP